MHRISSGFVEVIGQISAMGLTGVLPLTQRAHFSTLTLMSLSQSRPVHCLMNQIVFSITG